MTQKLNIEATLLRIMEYAAHSEEGRPLLIRTDSSLTSDILRDACERIIKNAKKVTIGNNCIIDDGLNIVLTSMIDESIELLKDKAYIIIVDLDFESNNELTERFTFIDCVNDKAIKINSLAAELEKLAEDLFIFAQVDSPRGLIPIQVNLVTKQCVSYHYANHGKLRRVGQMLDEIRPIKDSGRSIIFHNAFPLGIDLDGFYTTGDDYIIIDMMSRYKYVDRLVDKLKTDNA